MWELAALPALADPEDPPALGYTSEYDVWYGYRMRMVPVLYTENDDDYRSNENTDQLLEACLAAPVPTKQQTDNILQYYDPRTHEHNISEQTVASHLWWMQTWLQAYEILSHFVFEILENAVCLPCVLQSWFSHREIYDTTQKEWAVEQNLI